MSYHATSRASRWRLRLESLANGLAVLLGAVSLAVVIAYWAWYAWGPTSERVLAQAPASPVATLRATPLFGGMTAAPQAVENVALDGNLRLLGVVAEHGGDGYAIFRTAAGVYIARTGDAIGGTGGQATLTRIEPNAITIREASGTERRVVLRTTEGATKASSSASKNDSTANAAANTTATPTSSAKSTVTRTASATGKDCVPAGFKGGVVRLNAELLQGALMQPETFTTLLTAKAGALVVRESSGHAAMLGLQAADVLQSANGIALTRAEDIGSAILKPLAAGQSVLLKGQRGDQARELLLVNASVCSS